MSVNLIQKYKPYVDSELVKNRLLEQKELDFIEPLVDKEYFKFKNQSDVYGIVINIQNNNADIPYSFFGFTNKDVIERFNVLTKSFFRLTYYTDLLFQNEINTFDVNLGNFVKNENSVFNLTLFNPLLVKQNSEAFYIYAPKSITNVYVKIDFYCAKNGKIYNLVFGNKSFLHYELSPTHTFKINDYPIINSRYIIDAKI
jgi:hypothetical protein